VRLSVTDTGCGMDAETLRRSIEPFFTTKGVGRGTGLGLSMVHGLAAQSGGELKMKSSPGKGTTAVISLPVSDEALNALADGRQTELVRAPGRTSVMLVDDEELVRFATAEMLFELGYEVIPAASGMEALQIVKGGSRVDILVTDYAMPGMSGATLARELRQLRPGLPVLLITGYATLSDLEAGGLPRLAKPFHQVDLAARIADLLSTATIVHLHSRSQQHAG
jgi:CheY-like chemotaxis protein